MKKFLWMVVGVLLVALLFAYVRKMEQTQTERITALQKASIGYPASEEVLENDHVYWVNVSGVDKFPNHTNYVAMLQETKVRSSSRYRLSGTNRLFTLGTNLAPNLYYRFRRDGTNTWFERISDPLPALQ